MFRRVFGKSVSDYGCAFGSGRFSISKLNNGIVFLLVFSGQLLNLQNGGEARATLQDSDSISLLMPGEYDVWGVDFFKIDKDQYSVINRKAKGVNSRSSIAFSPSMIPRTVKLCSTDYFPPKILEQMSDFGEHIEGTLVTSDGTSGYWVTFTPAQGKKGEIVFDKFILAECSSIEIKDKFYLFEEAKGFDGPLRETVIPDSPLKIKLNVVEKHRIQKTEYDFDNKQTDFVEVSQGFGSGKDDKPGKPYPYQRPIDDKEQQAIIMLSLMGLVFSWEDVRSWYNNWQQTAYDLCFPGQARGHLLETIADIGLTH